MTRGIACLTLDVEADHHDLAPGYYVQALDHEPTWAWLLAFSRQRDLPWTAFVVGQLLETRPELVARLASTGWELGLHAYSHSSAHADTLEEIRRGKAAFRGAFGYDPAGYRAPLGKITSEGLRRLQREGFRYDASLFPAWRPGVFNNLDRPTEPFLIPAQEGTGPLVEIPAAVVPRLRVIVSVSYLKLLGLPFYRVALSWLGLPRVAVITCHLHDLAPAPAAYSQLPLFWKLVYRRNRERGREMLVWLVDWLAHAGYEFRTLGAVAKMVVENSGHV